MLSVLAVPEADDIISVKVDESGWAWMVCGELLIIWKICQTVVAKVRSVALFKALKLLCLHFVWCSNVWGLQ